MADATLANNNQLDNDIHVHCEKTSGEDHDSESETPPIDYEEAAAMAPSRLKGKALTFMVTFVAGTGVS